MIVETRTEPYLMVHVNAPWFVKSNNADSKYTHYARDLFKPARAVEGEASETSHHRWIARLSSSVHEGVSDKQHRNHYAPYSEDHLDG